MPKEANTEAISRQEVMRAKSDIGHLEERKGGACGVETCGECLHLQVKGRFTRIGAYGVGV